jgi:predicted HTH domain antitoxin
MSITFDLPQDVERDLRKKYGDLSQAAKEAFLVDSYRESRLSVGQIARSLKKGVIETQAWLSERGAPLSYSMEDLEADRQTIAKLFSETRR